jgi:hypothetical protein
MARILALASFLVLVFPDSSYAADRLVDLPDGGLAVEFNGIQVRLPEHGAEMTGDGLGATKSVYKVNFWPVAEIRKDRAAFDKWLPTNSHISFGYLRESFDPTLFTAEIAYPVPAKRQAQILGRGLTSGFQVHLTVHRSVQTRFVEQWRQQMRSLDRQLERIAAEGFVRGRYGPDAYAADGFVGTTIDRLGGPSYPPKSLNRLPAHLRQFPTGKDWFVWCIFGAVDDCVWDVWSDDERIFLQVRFSALWARRSWIEFDGHINKYLKALFPPAFRAGWNESLGDAEARSRTLSICIF